MLYNGVMLLGCFPNRAVLCLMSWRAQKSFNVFCQHERHREGETGINPAAWAYRKSLLSPVRNAGTARHHRKDRIFIPPHAMPLSTAAPCSCSLSALLSLTSVSNPWWEGPTRMEACLWLGELCHTILLTYLKNFLLCGNWTLLICWLIQFRIS